MTDSGIPPINPQPTSPITPNASLAPTGAPSNNPFAKAFPGASPEVLTKITNNFINYSIQQMKQDQQNMEKALKEMQDNSDSY